ncbi:hypothetical protein T03_5778 [Trichinella britovi]|uniref:Uncharacterized protein n=1 Tax=Trichinella britovi TaxID=45882 RepID=A0A0V1C9Q6_TRIBR|nr:hypothetical protein T03_5778 [Trichinella britovi]
MAFNLVDGNGCERKNLPQKKADPADNKTDRRTACVWSNHPEGSNLAAAGQGYCTKRVTILCCENATSSDRLQLLLVRESKRPRAMIVGMQKLPMVVFSPPNASSLVQPMDHKLLFKLSREEVEQWLANDDISLFEPLSDDEIFETMEKDENEDAQYV